MQSLQTIRERRAASIWTRIHPVFAVGQVGVFLVSVVLLGMFFLHRMPFAAVYVSVLLKIGFMLGAIVTGALWEHDVYGKWWFAHEFFVEDVMTVNVLLLHLGFVATVYLPFATMSAVLALLTLAYFVYGLNVVQYVVRHHGARKAEALESETEQVAA